MNANAENLPGARSITAAGLCRDSGGREDEGAVTRFGEPKLAWHIALCVGIASIVFWVDVQLPPGVAMGVPHVLVILFSLRIGDGRVTYGFALICTLLTLLGFHFSPDNSGGTAADPWMVLMNRLVALLAIWSSAFMGIRFKALVAQQQTLLQERELALKEIKILKGRLPICAHCKRIRDGQDRWLQLEAYLLDHSEAKFSHGICPECLEENFAEYLPR